MGKMHARVQIGLPTAARVLHISRTRGFCPRFSCLAEIWKHSWRNPCYVTLTGII